MNFCHWPTDLYTAQPYVVELSVRIVSKSERPIIPGNRKNKQKLQMKQNPTNSIKARYRVGLRAKNHIKITSDNLMLSEVIVFHLPFLRTTWDARFYRILYHILPNWNAAILGSNFYGFWRVRTAKKAAMSFWISYDVRHNPFNSLIAIFFDVIYTIVPIVPGVTKAAFPEYFLRFQRSPGESDSFHIFSMFRQDWNRCCFIGYPPGH